MPDFDDLLLRTSRTFGLAIPLLDEPCRRDLTLAYLLFRIADTLEDADALPPGERIDALLEFCGCLRDGDVDEARELTCRWTARPPTRNADYMHLLAEFPALLTAIGKLGGLVPDIIVQHAMRTARRMATFVPSEADGVLTLGSLDDLRRYCYAVAGIVGEMITELFLERQPELRQLEHELRAHAAFFGEGLQLVNILKDADEDARQGRIFLPAATPRQRVFELARADLIHADQYVAILQQGGADGAAVRFTELPILLARRTLDRTEQQGAGKKLTRAEVAEILDQVDASSRDQCNQRARLLSDVELSLAASRSPG